MQVAGHDWLSPTVKCSACGAQATINIHADQGEIIDWFYECPCGAIIENEGELTNAETV